MTLPAVLNLVTETALLFAVLLAAAKLASARMRVVLFRAAIAVALLAPLAVVAGAPRASVFSYPAAATREAGVADVSRAWRILPPTRRSLQPPAGSIGHLSPGSAAASVLLAIWLLGALALSGRYLRSLVLLRRAAANGSEPMAQVGHLYQSLRQTLGGPSAILTISDAVAAPCAFGILRPRILLPARFAGEHEILGAVLAHELCHVRNRDVFWLMLGQAACALYWFNPLVWMCAGRHRDDVEIVCDEAAAGATRHPETYVAALIHAVRTVLAEPAAAAASMSALGVAGRVRLLLEREAPLPKPAFTSVAAICLAAAAALALFATTGFVAARTPPAQQGATNGHAIPPRHDGPAFAGRTAREELKLGPNQTLLYVDSGLGVAVSDRKFGFMCEGESCKFTLPKQAEVMLRASSQHRVRWQGCTPSADGDVCVLTTGGPTARVRATAAD